MSDEFYNCVLPNNFANITLILTFLSIALRLGVDSESLSLFLELVERECGRVPYDRYNDDLKLSEFLDVPRLSKSLAVMGETETESNLAFAIERVLDMNKSSTDFTSNFTSILERSLSKRVNECLALPRFVEMPVASVYRIVEGGTSDLEECV